MFDIGDYIVCGSNGVCRVKEIGPLSMNGADRTRKYYTLEQIYPGGGRIFTPVDNQKVVMRPVLSKAEADELVDEMTDIDILWISNDRKREDEYKQALRKCDCKELVRIIKTLYQRKKTRIAAGKKVTAADEKYFKIAEDCLYGELAISFNMEKDEVKEYIKKCVD